MLTPHLVLSTIQIFIKGIPGRTAGYNVYPSTTVDALKVLIFNREGIPTELQRLSRGCTILEGPRTLDDQGVIAEAEVKLLLRLRGGMAKIKKEKVDTSASNKATKKAKAKILSKNAVAKKLSKREKRERNRAQHDSPFVVARASHLQRLEKFARAVDTLRKRSLNSGGSAKDVAEQLQAISDTHCIEDVLRRGKPDALELEKMEAQLMFRYDQGKRERAEAFRRRIWPRPEHVVQKIKQEHGDDDGHILLKEAGLDGQYIKQEASAPFSDFDAQAIGQQTLAFRPRSALSAAQSLPPPPPPEDNNYRSYNDYIPPPPPPDHALPHPPTGFIMPGDDEPMETHTGGASQTGSRTDASYAQWLQEQEDKMAMRSGALRYLE